MKIILIYTFILFGNWVIGQEKNCNTINGPLKYCDIEILSETNDTIKCIMKDNCAMAKYDITKNATWLLYSQDSSSLLEVITYCNGKENKQHTLFYRNGKLKSQSNYEDGNLIGPYITYYENGSIESSGIFSNGHFVGTSFKYWDNGKVAEIRIDTETSYYGKYVTYYDPLGNSITQTEFKQMWYCH